MQYDYLLQSMLAVAASHLTLISSSQLKCEALSYRIKAISGLNQALSTPPKSKEDADAIMAACAALSFQTQYIGESFEECLTMTRGCILVLNENWPDKFGTSFKHMDDDSQKQIMLSLLTDAPLVDESFVVQARHSLDKLRGLQMDKVEDFVRQHLTETAEQLSVSSLLGKRSCSSPFWTIPV